MKCSWCTMREKIIDLNILIRKSVKPKIMRHQLNKLEKEQNKPNKDNYRNKLNRNHANNRENWQSPKDVFKRLIKSIKTSLD